MTGDRRPRSIADGWPHHATLFESFPDPLLAYSRERESDKKGETESDERDESGSDESRVDSDTKESSLVVRRINPAFAATFDVGIDAITSTPLDKLVLAGRVIPGPDGDDAAASTDTSDPNVDGADTGSADPVDTDAEDAAESIGEAAGSASSADFDATDPPVTTTADSILDRLHADTGTGTRFKHGAGGERRHFRVRAVATGAADEQGYLLFTDVTGLERRRRNLAETVARLERIGSVARHDLRNPLEVAKIRLEAARDTGEDVHFQKIAGALDRIEHIVQDVLAVGSGDIDPTGAIALADVAAAAWETVDTADATLVASTELPTVRGDPDRLRQLFENLFRNAVEHGGRDVTVTVDPLPGGFVVADDGPGVPEEVRERAFEAGYSTAPDNSGLGLSIVKQIAREHGWHVSLVSGQEPYADTGTRFEFTGVERVKPGDDKSESDGSGGSVGPGASNGSN